MEYTTNFLSAFNHTMLYEVGGFWNPSDPDVINGTITTNAQRQKVGYVNIPQDRGGETKYGVARNANPNVDVYALDLSGAQQIYFEKYWLAGSCDKLSDKVALMHFDTCVNMGVGRGNKFLQQVVGAVVDGQIGPKTLAAVNAMNPSQLIVALQNARIDFYNSIVQRNPSQQVFLKGWLRRVNEVAQFALK